MGLEPTTSGLQSQASHPRARKSFALSLRSGSAWLNGSSESVARRQDSIVIVPFIPES